MKRYIEKQKCEDQSWLTNGLRNACKKKNALYREFLKTKEAEKKYKKYNKLTNTIRKCRKEY